MGSIAKAKHHVDLAENAVNHLIRAENYKAAAKYYLNAASNVSQDYVKRSLLYLSASCVHKSSIAQTLANSSQNRELRRKENESDTVDRKAATEAALMLESQRLIHIAHTERLKRIELVSSRFYFSIN